MVNIAEVDKSSYKKHMKKFTYEHGGKGKNATLTYAKFNWDEGVTIKVLLTQ